MLNSIVLYIETQLPREMFYQPKRNTHGILLGNICSSLTLFNLSSLRNGSIWPQLYNINCKCCRWLPFQKTTKYNMVSKKRHLNGLSVHICEKLLVSPEKLVKPCIPFLNGLFTFCLWNVLWCYTVTCGHRLLKLSKYCKRPDRKKTPKSSFYWQEW